MKTKSKLIISYAIGLAIILSFGLVIQKDLLKSKNTALKTEVVLNEKENSQKSNVKEENKKEETSKTETVEKKQNVQTQQTEKEVPFQNSRIQLSE